MKAFWKPICILSLILLLAALSGCHRQAAEAYDEAEAVIPAAEAPVTEAPTAA